MVLFQLDLEDQFQRKESRSAVYINESAKQVKLEKGFEKQFKANMPAWNYFQSQAPFYRKVTYRWVMSAKQETTRQKRLNELISSCEAGDKIKAMKYGKK